VARFLSADPLIQDPEHSQSYNRYSYVWNNPTNLTDPTGFAACSKDDKTCKPRPDNSVIPCTQDSRKECDGKRGNHEPTGNEEKQTPSKNCSGANCKSAQTNGTGFDGTKGCGQCGRHNPGSDPYVAPPQEGVESHCPECYLIGTGGLIRGIARNMAVKLGLAEAEAAAVAATPSVWTLSPFERGVAIENQLGHNLPRNFPVIDRFENGVATSIKSMDLSATTYQSIPAMERTLTGYIDKVAGFNGRTWAGVTVNNVSSRALELAIPVARTVAQQGALVRAVQYAHSVGVNMRVITIP